MNNNRLLDDKGVSCIIFIGIQPSNSVRADIFANVMAGNINAKTEQGRDMHGFIIGELMRVISP